MVRERQGRESWTGHAARTQRGRKQQQKKIQRKKNSQAWLELSTAPHRGGFLPREGGKKTDSRLKDYGRGSEYLIAAPRKLGKAEWHLVAEEVKG